MAADELERELGFLDATSIGLGTMIGGGIFILPSIAAEQAGPASAVSFAIGGFISLLSALSHAELATAEPKSGGGYEYVFDGLGPLAGSVVGFGMWVGLIFATAFYAVGFAQYLTFFTEAVPIVAAAVALTALLTALNYRGAAEASELEDLIVLTLLVIILGFVALGAPNVDRETLEPLNPSGWTGVLATTGTVYVSLIGFSLIATVGAEVKRPARNLPLSMITAVVVPTVLYVLVMIVSTGVLPVDRLADSWIPVADVAREFAGGLGALAMALGAVLATVSSANASILSAGRVSFAMARDRVLSRWFRPIHETHGTPYRAILLTGVGIAAVVVLRIGIQTLAEVASFMYLITYGLVHVAVIRFRRSHQDYDPEFRIPGPLYPAVPIVGVLSVVAIMTQMRPVVIAGGAGLVVAGTAWYYVYVRSESIGPEGAATDGPPPE